MTDIQTVLDNSKIIISWSEIFVSDSNLKEMPERMREIIQNNSEKIHVFEIFYRSQGKKIQGFLLVPKTKITEKIPCIIYNRGGNRGYGEILPEVLFKGVFLPVWLALSGYCVAMSNYSGSSKSEGLDEFGGDDLLDVLELKNILQEIDFVDSENIGICGASRGGQMVYQSLAKVNYFKAAASVAGSSNLFRSAEQRPEMKKTMLEMFDFNNPKEVEKRSAVYWPELFCDTTPLLLIHGTADARVSPLDTIELAQKLYENKKPFRMMLYEGADHGITEFNKEKNGEIVRWFDRFLKNKESLPVLELHGM